MSDFGLGDEDLRASYLADRDLAMAQATEYAEKWRESEEHLEQIRVLVASPSVLLDPLDVIARYEEVRALLD